ncbi:hypothetical protein SAMN02745194_02404 [Roseomonas rosea]|jgi:hypothetical protein|uniref:Uncharacterized protein n=1 Tax=Muricoccus roseus TaxID=198092 RepID=A0A1M6INL5_9PROT|nr:hypothetical protein [Roseomonas rosea]SHJ36036.1 hypothetical protein SAMN02745194_02404 [Roseomonas rosea]
MTELRRLFLAAALAALPFLSTAPAEAQVTFGFGFGPAYPVYPAYPYPYPYAYPVPPPAWTVPPYPAYAPPPVVVVPPRPPGQTCYAGAYICPLDRTLSAGDACGCPAPNGGRAWGRVG